MLRRNKFYLLTLIILILSIIGLRRYYHHLELDYQDFVSDTQKSLNGAMSQMLSDELKVLAYLKDNKDFNFNGLTKVETDFPFFVYKSGRLVFWKDEVVLNEIEEDFMEGWHFYTSQAGQYLLLARKSDQTDVVLLFVCELFTNYSVNNDYVQPHYNTKIFSQDNIQLRANEAKDTYELKSNSGEILFHVQLGNDFTNHNEVLHIAIILLEILVYFLLLLLTWRNAKSLIISRPSIALLLFILGVIVLRSLMWLFDFPFLSEEVALFNPRFFASSILNPSFGALLINCILLFTTGAFVLDYLKNLMLKKDLTYDFKLSLFLSFTSYAIFLFIYGFIELIYKHSQWGVDISNAINPDMFKVLSILTFLLFGLFVFYIIQWIHRWQERNMPSASVFLRDQSLALGLFIIFAISIKAPFLWVGTTVLLLNLLVHFLRLNRQLKRLSFISFIYLFLIVSAISTTAAWSTYYMEGFQKRNDMSSYANRLFNDNDVLAEYLIAQMDESLRADRQIKNQFLLPITPYSSVINKIEKYYLSDYFDKYDKLVSIYDAEGNSLYPTRAIDFSAKFPSNQLTSKNLRAGVKLYLIGRNEDSRVIKKYVYLYEVKLVNYTLATISVELIPKKIQPDNVFPELLVDKRFVPNVQEVPYNYAVYRDDSLGYKVGTIDFPEVIQTESNRQPTLNLDGVKTTSFINGNQTIVFGEEEENLFSIFSKFSYFFILCFTVILAFSIYYFARAIIEERKIGLSAKIQLFFSLAFLIPLLSISISTISFVNVTFLQDIVKSYQQRISRVGDHLTSTIIDYKNGNISREDLNNELLNTTKMVNSDLNLFNLNGKLLITSQPQIFEKNLLSPYINQEAYADISFNEQKLFTLDEHIGNLDYKTAYSAIYSYNSGELIAILSSPFFKSSKEYDTLLANLLTNVFNIFVASFIVFIMLAYTATKILTQPLVLLKNKLAKVNLSEGNEPLNWPVEDEIGLLISEYNQMLLKLEKSKLALSKTEKESAWREMAQQVAHEIKNPLTPMKLSLQHLLMRLEGEGNKNTQAADKIKSILSQVDNLSDIATSFSSFAKMPIPDNDRTNISEILNKVVSLFKADNNDIKLRMPDQEIHALVDKKIIERIFNNMLINALQSAKPQEPLSIEVELSASKNKATISFKDNGIGIPDDLLHKIFLPNFTTKEEGSGIGLAIAKRGIEYAGGKIWVESEESLGTTFFIELQKMD